MESNCQELKNDETSKGDLNGNKSTDSDDDDNDAFYNELFTGGTPTIVSTDVAPWLDDSDTESSPSETVKFYINSTKSKVVAKYEGTEYAIGFLDLTSQEYSCFGVISETTVEMNVNKVDILISDRKFNIKRISERELSTNPKQTSNETLFKQLNLECIQFSSTEPFLAKFKDDIYFVGKNLAVDYLNLLSRTKKPTGTPIRIRVGRLKIDELNKTLDVRQTIWAKNDNNICIISNSDDSSPQSCDFPTTSLRRYVILHNICLLLEVEPKLIHSHDCGIEIYAEKDFPFNAPALQQSTSEKDKKKMAELDAKDKKKDRRRDKKERNKRDQSDADSVSIKLEALDPYVRPAEMKFNNETVPKRANALSRFEIANRITDYVNWCKSMIYLEEEENACHLKALNIKNIQFTPCNKQQYSFPIPDKCGELFAAIKENVTNKVFIRSKKTENRSIHAKQFMADIVGIEDNKIIIEIPLKSASYVRELYQTELYHTHFELNRLPYQLQHYAMKFIVNHELFVRLIDTTDYRRKSAVPIIKTHSLKSEGTMLQSLSTDQREAVKNILLLGDKVPYLLVGPPGTGKTHTLIALIEQIVHTTTENVLVCAPTNAACDEITEQLVNIINDEDLYRFYGNSCSYANVDIRIKNVSNFNGTKFTYPLPSLLYRFRVVVCTLASAGDLTRARIDKHAFKPDNFGYVIIDDCASVHEPMTFIPIAGLCSSPRKIYPKIILAGDPKQLKAITRSNLAKSGGYNQSWIETLTKTALYSLNTTNEHKNSYITHLDKNYRSHPEIFRLSNELFYDNAMKSSAKKDDINWFQNSAFLPSKKFPFIFKSVHGLCQRSTESNFSNDTEVDEIVATIKQLLPSGVKNVRKITQWNIGVVTPYHMQSYKIAHKLHQLNLTRIAVGTADEFRGRQKPVMIISTVRSEENSTLDVFDFNVLGQPEWLNFAINRAKCLVVIIGDPHMLSCNEHWSKVVQLCIKNKSFIQSDKIFTVNE